ncbi:MAG: hypothetical protein IKZ88_05830 [Neisseriaceae bacterium]|nr:hypothetical protein [Neisseriaceae bacterium]
MACLVGRRPTLQQNLRFCGGQECPPYIKYAWATSCPPYGVSVFFRLPETLYIQALRLVWWVENPPYKRVGNKLPTLRRYGCFSITFSQVFASYPK